MQYYNDYPICNSCSTITRAFVGIRVAVHCGNKYQNFFVSKPMIGTKFGFYLKTKKLGSAIHIKAKKTKKRR